MPGAKKPVNVNFNNHEYIGNGFYIVRTQAGFRQAFRKFLDEPLGKVDLRGYPREYPSVVSFSQQYEGYIYYIAKCIPFHTLKTAMSNSDQRFMKASSHV